ncbi:hypothetical protein [Venatoribacter cucullus]|uniref:Uncharacterized protein n=1 Tax=Venatoribacter cucullus TaxID=2661630 RepID=A0A9E8JP70_9GAMM|nr:hypothetical protein [Venatoribacter cucullus]QQD23703.1 hypothetical protein GJQ55_04025 [Venatoribacter cucullus]UZK03135.1 hypothetical protein GAY96_04040 [Venatoribacter cucullus]
MNLTVIIKRQYDLLVRLLKLLIKKTLMHVLKVVVKRPRLKKVVVGVLIKFPKLHGFVADVVLKVWSGQRNINQGTQIIPASIATISSRANQIYSDLLDALEKSKEHQ